MRMWCCHKKNKKVPGPPPPSTPSPPQNSLDPTKSTAYDQTQVDPPPPASTDLIMAQVQVQVGTSGAGPSFSNPQGSIHKKNKKVSYLSSTIESAINGIPLPTGPIIAHDQRQIDVTTSSAPQTQRKNWNSITASVGQDQAFKQVCDFLRNDEIGMVGIYGMGGVGKTTLLEKIRDEFLKPFDFKVIWIVVSKSHNVDSIQKDVMKKMDLAFDPSDHPYHRAEQISNSLDEKKVALLFDDIWERLDLKELGILGPTGRDTSIFKIIFTTRSEQVCDQMDPDEQIKVECLGWDDSWALFEKSVGRKILESDYEIEPIAKKIAEECKGLPLALTVIGRAMKGKKDRRQWEYALITLQKSSLEDPDTEKQLFARLKLSYDSLPDNGEKNCFLYCCLFPEDEEIEGDQLIEYWIAEGFLALSGSYLEVSKRGADIIGTLQAACLLERAYSDKYVKMHDVVRDMGLWIATKLTLNIFMHGGSPLIKSEIEEKWREAHRIYVRRGDGFPEQPLCPNLTTLIIDFEDEPIEISNSFFNSMGKLRVLKLKNVYFGDEKVEIGQLLELRYLSVGESNLRTLPTDIIKLSKLEVLDLRENGDFEGVPENSIRRLVELRKLALDLHSTRKLTFDAVIMEVGYLSKLEILNMDLSDSNDESCEEPEGRVDMVNSVLGQLCDSLRDLDMWGWPFAGPGELVSALEQLDKLVIMKINRVKLPGVVIFTSGFLPCLKTLEISRCYGLEKIEVSPWAFENIREVSISFCYELEKIEVSPRAFENIRELYISYCKSLKCIVGLEHLRRTLVKLTIEYMDEMEELMMEEVDDDDEMEATAALSFPTLKYIKLGHLLELKSICSDDVQFPSLTTFNLWECPKIKKLPRGLMNEKRTLTKCAVYEGRKWWSGLMWQDDGFKSFIDSTLTHLSRKVLLPSESDEEPSTFLHQ